MIDPWPYMGCLERILDTQMDYHTKKMMKKQNVPRKMYSEGIGWAIYKQYGWVPLEEGSIEDKEFDKRRRFAAEHASREAMEVLDQLCVEYEAKYLKK